MICEKCGRRIRNARLLDGKWIPIDQGVVFWRDGEEDRVLTMDGKIIRCKIVHPLDDTFEGIGFVPHAATCGQQVELGEAVVI